MVAIPSPAAAPTMTAVELLSRIEQAGGRVLRASGGPPDVFVLTTDGRLARWLVDHGAHLNFNCREGGYPKAPGVREWDVWIHPMPVIGEQSIYEAAAK